MSQSRPAPGEPEVCAGAAAGQITISVVSHGHDDDVRRLLEEISQSAQGWVARVVVTHNLPPIGDIPGCDRFEVVQLVNTRPQGFARNHNLAFEHCVGDFFCILNPDVHGTTPELWSALVRTASLPGVACAYPELHNPDGSQQDHERALLTPWGLWWRRAMRRPETRVDWVSAACWVVPASVWRSIGGFDEGFRMYVEDAQWCLRAQIAGLRLARAQAALTHRAHRASRRSLKYLGWHLFSLLRLWSQPVFYHYLRLRDRLPVSAKSEA
ncbi:MAG: hypothetical protein RLZ58_69 [Pseudomonadota bacterium]